MARFSTIQSISDYCWWLLLQLTSPPTSREAEMSFNVQSFLFLLSILLFWWAYSLGTWLSLWTNRIETQYSFTFQRNSVQVMCLECHFCIYKASTTPTNRQRYDCFSALFAVISQIILLVIIPASALAHVCVYTDSLVAV
jgi:hypothetical protein